MIPGEIYARRDGADGAIRIVGVDSASGAVLITSASEFGEVFGVTAQSIGRHYALKQSAGAPSAWETPIEELTR